MLGLSTGTTPSCDARTNAGPGPFRVRACVRREGDQVRRQDRLGRRKTDPRPDPVTLSPEVAYVARQPGGPMGSSSQLLGTRLPYRDIPIRPA